MDFKVVIETLTNDFAGFGISYALIGGLAFNLWGVPRSTVMWTFSSSETIWNV